MPLIDSVLAQVRGGGSIKVGDRELDLDCEEKGGKLKCKYKWKAGSPAEAPVPEQPQPTKETEPTGSGGWFDTDEPCPDDGNPYCVVDSYETVPAAEPEAESAKKKADADKVHWDAYGKEQYELGVSHGRFGVLREIEEDEKARKRFEPTTHFVPGFAVLGGIPGTIVGGSLSVRWLSFERHVEGYFKNEIYYKKRPFDFFISPFFGGLVKEDRWSNVYGARVGVGGTCGDKDIACSTLNLFVGFQRVAGKNRATVGFDAMPSGYILGGLTLEGSFPLERDGDPPALMAGYRFESALLDRWIWSW